MRSIDSKIIDKTIGENIRITRLAYEISSKELANRIGISFQQIQKYETGENSLSVYRLIDISQALNIPIEKLLKGTDENSKKISTSSVKNKAYSERILIKLDSIKSKKLKSAIETLVDSFSE